MAVVVLLLLVPGCGDSESIDPMVANPPQPPPVNQQPAPEVEEPVEQPQPPIEQVTPFPLKELQSVQIGMERHFQISQNRQVMVGRSEDRTSVVVWDITGKKLRATLKTYRLGEGLFGRVAVSPDGSQVAAQIDVVELSGDTQIAVWSTDNPAAARIVSIPSLQLGEMAISNTELMVAYGPHVLIYSHLNGEHITNLSGHDDKEGISRVRALQISPSGRFLLSMGSDRIALLWDLETRKEIQIFDEHKDDVTCGAFGADERTIVTGSDDLSVKRWDVTTGISIQTWQLAEYDALKVAERKLQAFTRRMEAMVAAADGRVEFIPSPARLYTMITGVDLSDRSSTLLVNLFVGLKEDGSGINILFPGNPVLLDVVTEKPLSLVGSEVNEESIARQMSLGTSVSFFNRRGDGFWYSGVQFVRKRGKSIPRHTARELEIVGHQLTNAAAPVKQIAAENIKHREPPEDLVEAAKEVNPSDIFKEDVDIAEVMPEMMGMMGMMSAMEDGPALPGADWDASEWEDQPKDEFFLRDFDWSEFLRLQPDEGKTVVTDNDGTSVEYQVIKPLLDNFKERLGSLQHPATPRMKPTSQRDDYSGMENPAGMQFDDQGREADRWRSTRMERFEFGQFENKYNTLGMPHYSPGTVLSSGDSGALQGRFIVISTAHVGQLEGLTAGATGYQLLGGMIDEDVQERAVRDQPDLGAGGRPAKSSSVKEIVFYNWWNHSRNPGLFFCEVIPSHKANQAGDPRAATAPSVKGLPLVVDPHVPTFFLDAIRNALPGLTQENRWMGLEERMEALMAEDPLEDLAGIGMPAFGLGAAKEDRPLEPDFVAEARYSVVVRACLLLVEKENERMEDFGGLFGEEDPSVEKVIGPRRPIRVSEVDAADRFAVRIYIDVPAIERCIVTAETQRRTEFVRTLGATLRRPIPSGLGTSSNSDLQAQLLDGLKSDLTPYKWLLLLSPDQRYRLGLSEDFVKPADAGKEKYLERAEEAMDGIRRLADEWREHLGSEPSVVPAPSSRENLFIEGTKGKIRFHLIRGEGSRVFLEDWELISP